MKKFERINDEKFKKLQECETKLLFGGLQATGQRVDTHTANQFHEASRIDTRMDIYSEDNCTIVESCTHWYQF